MDAVNLNDVSVILNGKQAVRNLTWNIRDGEHWAILGANASGKTTLLRLINGYLWPASGTATVLGKTFGESDLRELRRSIGFVSSFVTEQIPRQSSALDVVLAGKLANIGLYEAPSPEDLQRAESLLDQVGCRDLEKNHFHHLSQGEKQRVVVARALMNAPRLLTLDEPCSGLDIAARERFLSFLQSLGKEKEAPTIILATHRVEEIPQIFTHALVMKDGFSLAKGVKREVLTNNVLSDAFSRELDVVTNGRRFAVMMPS